MHVVDNQDGELDAFLNFVAQCFNCAANKLAPIAKLMCSGAGQCRTREPTSPGITILTSCTGSWSATPVT